MDSRELLHVHNLSQVESIKIWCFSQKKINQYVPKVPQDFQRNPFTFAFVRLLKDST